MRIASRWKALSLFICLPVLSLEQSILSAQVIEQQEGERIQASADRAATPKRQPDLTEARELIVQETNEFRSGEDLPKVAADADLTKAAQSFAEYMARTDRYGHTADGNRPADRAAEQGYVYCIISENIAYQYRSTGFKTEELATRFVQGWKDSPEHRKNMLDGDVTEIGVGVARSEQSGNYYGVQMFGRPRTDRIEFQVANRSQTSVEYKMGNRTFTLPPRYTRTHEMCRPSEVTFLTTDGETEAATEESFQPKNGDRFTVSVEAGELTITRQK